MTREQQINDYDQNVDHLVNWLLEQDPELVLRWLFEMREGSRQRPKGFNWVGLAEISADLANEKADLNWARVAVLVNSFLISEIRMYGRVYTSARIVPPEQRELASSTLELRVLSLRVRFLLSHDSVPNDPVLDPKMLVQAFFQDLTLSPEEVLQQYAPGAKALSREQIWKLDRIRRNLAYLRPLAEQSLLPQELVPWYSIREQMHF
jgi:hypothetical protein